MSLNARNKYAQQLQEITEQQTQVTENFSSLQQQCTALKERVQVLEAIVTDKGFSVEQEISNL
ncbi:hypothetical protein [Pseudoalteromonas pernae]|uniref:hypothetical protein n=1 Tax=Pseudoalteromonas pernae TaxID=3118054 RepID=UPI00324216D8